MEDTKNVVISLREHLFLATGTSDHKAKARDSNIRKWIDGVQFQVEV
jgi:hypothetical protein